MPAERLIPLSDRILNRAALVIGFCHFLLAVYFGLHFFSITPYADTWNIIDEIVKNKSRISFPVMWAQHNEHRMAMSKLLMWADLYWARGKGYSLTTEIYLAQAATALLMFYAVIRLGKWRRSYAYAALGIALFCRFYLIQRELFSWSFCVQVAPTYALGALAYFSLAFYAKRGNRAWLGLAIVAGFLAPLNLAGGLLVFPVLCVTAWNLQVRGRTVLMLAGCGLLSIAIYMIGYVTPPGPKPMASFAKPAELLQYNLLYFAGCWDVLSRSLGYVLAAVAILVVILWNIKVLVRRDESPLRVALLALAASLIGNAFLTSLGRLSFGIEQAADSRYQTAALLFWCCTFLLSLDLLLHHAPRFTSALTGMAVALMLWGFTYTKVAWQKGLEFYDKAEYGAMSLIADIKDDGVVSAHLMGTPQWVLEDTAFLRARGLSIYDTRDFLRMGTRLVDLYRISEPGRCAGYLDRYETIPDPLWPGYRAFGWGWDRTLKRALERIVITNEHGKIIGLARAGLMRLDVVQQVPGVTSGLTGWRGYVSGALAWQRGQAYGELPGGREVCALPGNPPRP